MFAFGWLELGLNRREFGRLTPLEFRAMKRAWNRKQDREELRSASIVAALYNIHRDPEKHPEPFSALDFAILHEPIKKKQTPAKPVDVEAVNANAIAQLKAMTQALQGIPST